MTYHVVPEFRVYNGNEPTHMTFRSAKRADTIVRRLNMVMAQREEAIRKKDGYPQTCLNDECGVTFLSRFRTQRAKHCPACRGKMQMKAYRARQKEMYNPGDDIPGRRRPSC